MGSNVSDEVSQELASWAGGLTSRRGSASMQVPITWDQKSQKSAPLGVGGGGGGGAASDGAGGISRELLRPPSPSTPSSQAHQATLDPLSCSLSHQVAPILGSALRFEQAFGSVQPPALGPGFDLQDTTSSAGRTSLNQVIRNIYVQLPVMYQLM